MREGDALVASGQATSFAWVYGNGSQAAEDDRLDVARQLMCYLLARDQRGIKLEEMPWNRAARRRATAR